MTLPTNEQFMLAKPYLNIAADFALLSSSIEGEYHKTECVRNLQYAAEVMGFEIVQRAPNSMREAG